MYKYKVTYTYSVWENGQGWKLKDSYMGIDDVFTDDETVLDYNKGDLIDNMIDYVHDTQPSDRYDTRYTYTVYNTETNEELHSVSVWLSEIVDK